MRLPKPACCPLLFVGKDSFMRSLQFVYAATSLLVVLAGCNERRSSVVVHDACSLVSKEEIESVQATPVNDTKSSQRSDDLLRAAQCFYATAESSKSVDLALIQKDLNQPNNRSPKDFWKEKFDPYRDEEPKTNRGDEKEQGPAP
jgi:hypothetical protein